MTYAPEINRRYATWTGAWGYLTARGFACVADGWRNGRWLATVDHDRAAFNVRVWLPVRDAA